MDSGALLDLLGNENRRRILRLLARKPSYVTEISDYLDVSPKAVIDHLRRLDEAGLVESHVDDRRRKYFHIAQNLRLEVQVSPYDFGAKSAYPASADLDLGRCSHLQVTTEFDEATDVGDLAASLDDLRALERELSMAQRWVQGRLTEVQAELSRTIDGENGGHLNAEVLGALAGGTRSTAALAREVEIPEQLVETVLSRLVGEGVVEQVGRKWRIRRDRE
ncbi:ArsR family transcriptional regulator [Halodesulfurarchaeum formicicum]|uniref:ArsR family transcriptional regulator n=1 Tax=Halodesulfurarchaeum formicicum TaxID=1873524 RepID=A0A1D8S6R2_9EURY|nr:ArsR family transcriptional regulator [Halodesulfurarchaeum formicicum]AOW81035.1 ArsR family transcriptional regulator [Halodesulfurarchaeum formicicum]APE96372.1 ArsR family transcriptional regulator [Halodesulfurarchaeum formicicum]